MFYIFARGVFQPEKRLLHIFFVTFQNFHSIVSKSLYEQCKHSLPKPIAQFVLKEKHICAFYGTRAKQYNSIVFFSVWCY